MDHHRRGLAFVERSSLSDSPFAHEPGALAPHAQATPSTAGLLFGPERQRSTLLLKRREFSIHIAQTAVHRSKSSELVTKMYRARGYSVSETDPSLPPRDQVTFVACNAAGVFGTLTVCVDSPFGLPLDSVYGAELAAFRLTNKRLAELTGLAVDPRHRSREVLGALFHVSYVFGALRHIEDVFIAVHPRHVGFYTRTLRFAIAGDWRFYGRVSAPARLLHIQVSAVAEHAKRCSASRSAQRTLYSYFHSNDEALGIRARLKPYTGVVPAVEPVATPPLIVERSCGYTTLSEPFGSGISGMMNDS